MIRDRRRGFCKICRESLFDTQPAEWLTGIYLGLNHKNCAEQLTDPTHFIGEKVLTMSEETRRHLGIPIHRAARDHDWRTDGYCNCGASKPRPQRKARGHANHNVAGVRGKSNLDLIDGAFEAGNR